MEISPAASPVKLRPSVFSALGQTSVALAAPLWRKALFPAAYRETW